MDQRIDVPWREQLCLAARPGANRLALGPVQQRTAERNLLPDFRDTDEVARDTRPTCPLSEFVGKVSLTPFLVRPCEILT